MIAVAPAATAAASFTPIRGQYVDTKHELNFNAGKTQLYNFVMQCGDDGSYTSPSGTIIKVKRKKWSYTGPAERFGGASTDPGAMPLKFTGKWTKKNVVKGKVTPSGPLVGGCKGFSFKAKLKARL